MLRNLFCIVFAVVWTSIYFPVVCIAMLVTLDRSASMRFVKGPWARGLLWAGGARLEVIGAENVISDRPHIFVSNHQSTIDIPTLFAAIPSDFRFVAKKALMYVPFIGWYMWLARFVFVDRARHTEAVASMDKAASQIRGGISIAVFPEGTRSETRHVMPFKKGSFALAMKAGVPLVPVAIEGSGLLMPKNSWNITPGPIRVLIGKPIDPAQFGDDRDALLKAVRDAVVEQNLALGGLGASVKAASRAEATG
jgi:1-acyl-sn-glycerol-3-phosphate acyltransferase